MLLLHRRRSEAIDQYKGALDGERLADNRERPGTPNDSNTKLAQVIRASARSPICKRIQFCFRLEPGRKREQSALTDNHHRLLLLRFSPLRRALFEGMTMQRLTHDELVEGYRRPREIPAVAQPSKRKVTTRQRAREFEWLQILNQIDEDCGYRML